MAKAKLTPGQWVEARREWETNPVASYATVAAMFLISKALVGQRAAAEKWQRGIGVASHPKDTIAQGNSGNLQERPSTRQMDARLDASAAAKTDSESSASPARVVCDVYVAPSAPGVPADGVADRPEFTNGVDELAWIEEQVSIREKAILARHAVELKALTNSIYDAARKTGKAEMGAASRAANQLSQALERKQKMEREHCAMQTRIELGAHYGAGPRPAVIVVHQHPDGKLT